MSQKLSVDGFKCVEDLSKFNESFIKNYDENSNKGYILEADYPKNLHKLHSDLPFLPERKKIRKCNNLACTVQDRKLCCSHKKVKTSVKSRINTKKCAQCNSIKSRSMAKTIY